jgi:hypothetical protein
MRERRLAMNAAAAIFLIFLICFGSLILFGALISEYLDMKLGPEQPPGSFRQEDEIGERALCVSLEDEIQACNQDVFNLERGIDLTESRMEVLVHQLDQCKTDLGIAHESNQRPLAFSENSNRVSEDISMAIGWAEAHPFGTISLPIGLGLASLASASLAKRLPLRSRPKASQGPERGEVLVRMTRQQAHQFAEWQRRDPGKGN